MFDAMGKTTADELVSDSVLKTHVENTIRETLSPGETFWIDGGGIGHLFGNLHVSNVSVSIVDASGATHEMSNM